MVETETVRRWVLSALAVLVSLSAWGWWQDGELLLSGSGIHGYSSISSQMHYTMRWTVLDGFNNWWIVQLLLAALVGAIWFAAVTPERKWRRLSLLTCFILVVSFNARTPLVVSSPEIIVAVLVFWVMLLELSDWESRVLRAAQVQMALVFISPLILRFAYGTGVWPSGDAVSVIVHNDAVSRGWLAGAARGLPEPALRVITFVVIAIELAAGLSLLAAAVLSGVLKQRWRFRVWVSVCVLQVGIALTCGLWTISFAVALAASLVLASGRAVPRLDVFGLVARMALVCVVVLNALSLSSQPAQSAAAQRNAAAHTTRALGIWQVWSTFSPDPTAAQRWVELRDGNGAIMVDSRDAGSKIRKLAQSVMLESRGALADAWGRVACDSGEVAVVVIEMVNAELKEYEKSRVAC